MKKIFLTPFALIILLISNTCYAEWIDDYFASAVTTNPTAAYTQQRGYYTAGGFTAKLPYKREPLMTLSLPTIQTGCGGIDMFWGGVSFMNADYLVKKAQGILKNAPYVLFSIGLKALSTQFADTIEAVQAITDQLNQLQLDECSAAKGLISYAMNGEAPGITGELERLKTNTSNLKDGVAKTWNKITGKTDDKPSEGKKEVVDKKIKDPRAKELLTGSGYVLDQLVKWNDITQNEADAIRALVGDVYYNNNEDQPINKYQAGCASSISFNDYVVEKTPFQLTKDLEKQVCQNATNSIYERTKSVVNTLVEGYTNSSKRTAEFDAATLEFVNKSGIPAIVYLSDAALAGSDYASSMGPHLSDIISAGYAYGSLEKLSGMLYKVIFALKSNMIQQEYYTEGIVAALENFNNAIIKRTVDFQEGYNTRLTIFSTNLDIAVKNRQIGQDIKTINKNSLLTSERK